MLYTLIIIFKNRIKEKVLPDTENGSFRIDISEETGKKGCFLELENENGMWSIADSEHISLNDGDRIFPEEGRAYVINIKRTSVSAAVTMMISENEAFRKYIMPETVSIGGSSGSDIVVKHELASRNHAVITGSDKGYFIQDLSRNGVYVNGKKISEKCRLRMFDIIYIFGTKIIFLEGLAAVSVNSCTEVSLTETGELKTEKNSFRTRELKKRNPNRINENQEAASLVLKKPEYESSTHKTTDIADILKPAVPSAAVLSSSAALAGSLSIPVLAGVFAGTAVALSAAMYGIQTIRNRKNEKETAEKNEKTAETFYSECEERIIEKQAEYRKMLSEKYISAEEAADSFFCEKYKRDDYEFLKIRAGNGKISFRKFTDVSDKSDRRLSELCEKYSEAENMPLILDLAADKKYTVSGDYESVFSVMSSFAVLCSSLFDSSDVKLISLAGEKMRLIRWLMHSQSDDGTERFVSYDEASYRKISFMLSGILQKRCEKRRNEGTENFSPHYIVFCPSEKSFREDPLYRYAESAEELCVTFIFTDICEESKVQITGSRGSVIIPEDMYGISSERAEKYALRAAACTDFDISSGKIPEQITFTDMINFSVSENIDIGKNYRINRVSDGIRACVGIGKKGRFILDLHESMHGPHGLVAGTTGSGKSEFLQTLILSLAVEYSPSELAFVLIDYKGGGMSQVFENLPHTAGTVTNISEGCDIAGRALVSLKSEIRRRQKIFRDYSVNSVDAYMKLYREGRADRAMPHIIIICDEFAELKREKPEFISQLVSTARVGRSLGIHLILATQRPAGVIDNEIWSNSRFRICLKVQDRSDSIEMLRRPEAADITVTGRAYVQVGNDEIFEEIQTGYSGASYEDDSTDKNVRMLSDDKTDAVINIPSHNCGKVRTQLEVITERISEHCRLEGISSAEKLWTDPLPAEIYLSDICDEEGYEDSLSFTFGLVDNPEEQSMYPAVSDIYNSGNIIIAGSPGSGKSSFIMTAAYSLSEKYAPEKFRFSVLDFAGGLFSVFSKLPQSRSIINQPSEKEMSGFTEWISAETERRRVLFSETGAADFSEYRKMSSDICAEVVFLDGYGIFREMYPELEERFTSVSGNSAKYGIYLFVTVKQISDMRIRARQNFKTAVALELSDRADYTELLGIRPELLPASCPGRGLIKDERRVLEFQTALCCRKTGSERTEELSERFGVTAEKFPLKNEVIKSDNSDIYCSTVKDMTDDILTGLAENASGEGSVMIWYADKTEEKCSRAEYFYGTDGMFSLLLKLKHIFAQRNGQRKSEGKYNGENDVTVIFRNLDDVCRCIYDEEYREDMSAITETFFEKGSGLGVRFISGISEKCIYSDRKAFMSFISYSAGDDYVKSVCI